MDFLNLIRKYFSYVVYSRNVASGAQEAQPTQAVCSDRRQLDSVDMSYEYVHRLKHDHEFFMSELSDNAETLVKNYLRYYQIVPEAYIRRYLSNIKKYHTRNPLATLYIESELGAPLRMRELIRTLRNEGYDVNGKTVLDIGCSNGALLLACHEHGAAELIGVDIDEGRLNSGKLLVGEKNITLLNIDILSADLPLQYGPFDSIFATDVLEHVGDPHLFFVRLKRLLSSADGSFAFLSLFNRYYFENIRSEPHYNVPGMILLEHDTARELWNEVRDAMHSTLDYEIGHWHSFEEYAVMADNVGLELTLFGKCTFETTLHDYPKTIADFRRDVWQRIEGLPASDRSKQSLNAALSAYCDMYDQDHCRYAMGTCDKSALVNKYYRQPLYMLCRHRQDTPDG